MRLRNSFALAVATLVAALAVAVPATALTAPYFATNLPENGIFGQMVDQPQAVRHGDVTYVAYQGPGLDPYIATYNWTTRTWTGPVKAGVNVQTTDAHGSPTLFIDPAGYVHIYYGPHREALSHTMSKVPNSITGGWVTKPKIGSDVTYPQVVRVGEKVMLFYRGADDIWESLESADGSSWTNRRQLTDAHYPSSFYCSFREGPDHNSVLVAMVRMEWNEYFAKTSFGRHDVFFAQLKQNDMATYTWRSAQDDTLTVPITQQSAKAEALVEDTGAETANIPVPGFEGTGTIGVLFNRGTGSGLGSYRYRFARANEESWTVTTVATTDHFYDAATWRAEKNGDTTETTVYAEYLGSKGKSVGPFDYTDIGGEIHRFTPQNASPASPWVDRGRIDPGTSGSLLGPGLYHNPHLVTDGTAQDRVIFQELCPGVSIEGYGGYLWGEASANGFTDSLGLVGRTYRPAVARIAASDRYAEAAAIGKRAFPQGTGTVIVASGETFADALVAAPLANALDAPILLVRHDALPSATASAISYLQPDKAIVIGGKTSVQDGVVKALLATHISKVERIAAGNRYDTAALVAVRLWNLKGDPANAYIANGEKFADGLSVGSVAAARGEPVLLVRPGSAPESVTNALEVCGPKRVVVVGGSSSVTPAVASSLGASTRLDGATRYDVADRVAEFGLANGLSPRRVVVVTGQVFPDCLTAAVLAARLHGVTLLTPSASLSAGADAHLRRHAAENLDVLVCGGTASVSNQTYAQIQTASKVP